MSETHPTTLRLFVGWPIPDAIRDEIRDLVSPLRTKLPRASWTRPETYHITFAFLGDHPDAIVPRLAGELEAALEGTTSFEVRAAAPGFFPSMKRPRVGWIAVDPEDRLGDVARRIRHAIGRSGLTMDRKPFTAHLTLVRIRDGWPPSAADEFLARFEPFESSSGICSSISLFASRLEPSGAVHTELHRVEFRPA